MHMRGKDLLRELQRTVDELAVLNEIGKALTSSLDIGEVMHIILAKVSELLKPRNWSLLMKDQATGELYFHAAVGAGIAIWRKKFQLKIRVSACIEKHADNVESRCCIQ